MPNYKVLEEFELDDVLQEVDSVIELSEEAALPLFEEGKIEIVTPAPSAE